MLCTKIFYSNTVLMLLLCLRDSKTLSMQRIASSMDSAYYNGLYYRCQSTFFCVHFLLREEFALIFSILNLEWPKR